MKQELEQAIAVAVKELFDTGVQVELTRPDEQFGDYATNIALQLTKQLGKNPREIAEALADKLTSDDRLQSVELAGPGFLNLTLKEAVLAQMLTAKPTQTLTGKKVLVEYSDPNPFKPLHAGHLYTTLVGDTIARLIENTGAKTIRINYGGDVGLHVGKSMWAIVQTLGGEQPEKLQAVEETDRPKWLGIRYVEGNNAYEDDAASKQEIIETNKRVYQLHEDDDHDSPFAQIYWTCRQWSYEYFKTLYDQMQVAPFSRYIPESEVTPLGLATVQQQYDNGVFELGDAIKTAHDDGSESVATARPVIFQPKDEALHARVFINSAGLPTYETKDIGLSLTKWQDYHFDDSIIITANEQDQYMRVVLDAIRQFAPEPADRTLHITHGVVKLQGGVKMSSRKGNVVTALEILDAARQAGQETGTNPSEETILAAVKYAFAKVRVGGDIAYDPKESIALEGNSGPYLQYAHARARSILGKASGSNHSEQGKASNKEILHSIQADKLQPNERSLLRKITEYAEVVERATDELMPHHICTYLYELAQKFNQFYEHNRVIGDEREAVRLQLVSHYANTLQAGLRLLGIAAPDHM